MLLPLLIIVTIALLLFLLSMVWPPDSPWSPWWRTSGRVARLQCQLAKIHKGDIVYDLGCGDGTALITAAKEFGACGVGVEIDPFRYWIAKIRMKLNNVPVRILRKNFFDVDVSDATVVIMYLIPKALNQLKPKLMKELKPGMRIVTFVYKIDLPLIASDLKQEVFVFEMPKN
jgi:predicted RNA methylase